MVFTCLFAIFPIFAILTPTALPLLIFIAGLLSVNALSDLKPFLPVAALSGAILLLAFFRSDFVGMLFAGEGLARAYQHSTRYFQAPVLLAVMIWAVISHSQRLGSGSAYRLFRWFGWVMLGLVLMQLADVLGGEGLRNAMNRMFFHGARPEMVVVRTSDFNALIAMLFWPMSYYFSAIRRPLANILMAVTVVIAAVVVDTNAHILMMIVGALAYWTARLWPRRWSMRGIRPERVYAVAAAGVILAVPAAIASILLTGRTQYFQTHLPPSWAARIDIWSFTVEQCLKRPLWGWGYESSRNFGARIPDHPHDMALQAWLELGLPGLALVAALWFCLFWFAVPRGDAPLPPPNGDLVELGPPLPQESFAPPMGPYVVAAIAAYFVLNLVSYGLWRDWLYSLGALVTLTFIIASKALQECK